MASACSGAGELKELDDEEVGDVASGTALASVAFRFQAAPLPLADNAFLSTTGFALGLAGLFGIGGAVEVGSLNSDNSPSTATVATGLRGENWKTPATEAGACAGGVVVVLAIFALKPRNADCAFLESGVAGLELEVAEGVGCFGFGLGFDVGFGVGRDVVGLRLSVWLRRRRSVDRAVMSSALRLRLRPREPSPALRPSSKVTVTMTHPFFFGM